jgi:hypothetical protein
VARRTIKAALEGIETATRSPFPTASKGKSLADFRSTYDKSVIVPAKIKAGLKELGANGWEYEVAFARIAGISMADLGNFRDGFAEYVVSIRERRAWAGSKNMADKMRAMI